MKMSGIDLLYLTVRAWSMWVLVPGIPRRLALVLGLLCALLVFEPSWEARSVSVPWGEWNILATVIEACVGLLVVVPLLVPVWIAEVVGGMIDISTNLSFASVVNPLAPGSSKGVWSTVCRELTFGRLVIISLFPRLIAAYATTVPLVAPGSGVISPTIISQVTSAWIGVGGSLLGAIVPLLIGCLIVEGLVGVISRTANVNGTSAIGQLMKFGLGAGFVSAVMR